MVGAIALGRGRREAELVSRRGKNAEPLNLIFAVNSLMITDRFLTATGECFLKKIWVN
jgi:hypothetical protein